MQAEIDIVGNKTVPYHAARQTSTRTGREKETACKGLMETRQKQRNLLALTDGMGTKSRNRHISTDATADDLGSICAVIIS
jgi:hypothetical protein